MPPCRQAFVTLHESLGDQFHAAQEMGGKADALQVLACRGTLALGDTAAVLPDRNLQRLRLAESRADEDSVEALFEEAVDGNLYTDMRVTVDHHTHLLDIADLTSHHLLGQSVFRDTIA